MKIFFLRVTCLPISGGWQHGHDAETYPSTNSLVVLIWRIQLSSSGGGDEPYRRNKGILAHKYCNSDLGDFWVGVILVRAHFPGLVGSWKFGD